MDNYLIDPELQRRQAQGIRALSELKAIQGGNQLATALRQSETPLYTPGSPTQWGYSGDTFLNVLANAGTRHQGRQKLGALDARSNVLRGQAEQGQLAELEASEQKRLKEMEFQEQLQKAAQEFKREQTDEARDDLISPFKTFVNERGDKIVAANTRRGPVDSQGEPVDLTGFWEYKPLRANQPGANQQKQTPKERKEQEDLSKSFSTMDRVKDTFKDNYANPEGYPFVNSLKLWAAQNVPAVTNEKTEEASQWWADYRREHEIFSRHLKFGSALTESEKELWDQANITPEMEPDDIRESLRIQEALLRKYGANKRAIDIATWGSSARIDQLFPPEVFYVDDTVSDEITRALVKKGILSRRPGDENAVIKTPDPEEDEQDDKEKRLNALEQLILNAEIVE